MGMVDADNKTTKEFNHAVGKRPEAIEAMARTGNEEVEQFTGSITKVKEYLANMANNAEGIGKTMNDFADYASERMGYVDKNMTNRVDELAGETVGATIDFGVQPLSLSQNAENGQSVLKSLPFGVGNTIRVHSRPGIVVWDGRPVHQFVKLLWQDSDRLSEMIPV